MGSALATVREAFGASAEKPLMSLRGGNAVDNHAPIPQYDPGVDRPNGEYFEAYFWGLPHLDPSSWHYYLPLLLVYALQHITNGRSNAIESLLSSLRPPDRDPPRFGSLTSEQERAVVVVLDELAFAPQSVWQEQAMVALEEFWGPGATYRRAGT
jgi:hypothetical protein